MMPAMKSHNWQPITDLPENWLELTSTEIAGLASAWIEYSLQLRDSPALKQFNERLRREWAIETGIIENLYSIDRGTTRLLIEKGIREELIAHGAADKPAEQIVPIIRDQEEVVEGLCDFINQKRALSTSYLKQLHQALTRHQKTVVAKDTLGEKIEIPLLRGEWKKQPNNPTRPDKSIHEFCPPEQTASEIDRLIELHQLHLSKDITPEVEAAWLHHRFTQIHPFQDGNGRMARTLASLVLLRAGWFPLVIHRDDREVYIDALEEADRGDLKPLVMLFSRVQKKAINQALSLSKSVLLEGDPLQQVIAAAAERLKAQKQKGFEESKLTDKLERIAEEKLRSLAAMLRVQLQTVDERYDAHVSRVDDKFELTGLYPVAREIAEKSGYHPDFPTYSNWIKLEIQAGFPIKLILSFHALGQTFTGIIAVSAFILPYIDWSNFQSEKPFPLGRNVFQFAVTEPEQEVLKRFETWLDQVTLEGIDRWRKQL